MRHLFVWSLLAWSAVSLLASCVPCDRSGCKALDHRARDVSIATGIAGAAAHALDTGTNNCTDCPLTSGTLLVWAVADAVTTEEHVDAVLSSGGPTLEIDIDEHYEQTLDAGEYLVCTDGVETCAGITVGNAVVTVHASYAFAAQPSLVVFEPGSKEPRSERIFNP